MEDVIVKPRYPRNTTSSRKKRMYAKEGSGLGEVIKRQLLISVLIFIVISCTKIINTPAADFVTSKIKWVLSWDINVNDIYEQINSIITGESSITGDGLKGAAGGNVIGNGEGNAIEGSMGATATGEDGEDGENSMDVDKKDGEKAGEKDENRAGGNEENKAGENEEGKSKEEDLYQNGHEAGLEFILPVEGHIASYFGEIADSATGTVSFHSGIDIEGHGVLNIRAVEDGEVLEVSESRDYGKYLKIRHAGGIISLYAHCSAISVKEGTKINKGGIIAEIGNDRLSISIGTHLHFEIWKEGKPADPLEFIKLDFMKVSMSSLIGFTSIISPHKKDEIL